MTAEWQGNKYFASHTERSVPIFELTTLPNLVEAFSRNLLSIENTPPFCKFINSTGMKEESSYFASSGLIIVEIFSSYKAWIDWIYSLMLTYYSYIQNHHKRGHYDETVLTWFFCHTVLLLDILIWSCGVTHDYFSHNEQWHNMNSYVGPCSK